MPTPGCATLSQQLGAVLPDGVVEHCRRAAHRIAALLDAWTGQPGAWQVDDDRLAAHIGLPWVVAQANGLEPPVTGSEVAAAPGGGWVLHDRGPDDGDAFERLLDVLDAETSAGAPAPDAEELARRAQEWRLAVTPFRDRCRQPAGAPTTIRSRTAPAAGPRRVVTGCVDRPLDGVTVVDLTVTWAGPFATWVLAQLGAAVVKVEPPCRPDGLRRGARPAGAGRAGGALFIALDHGKSHESLDLRDPVHLARFEALVAGADVVVDNLSRRVRPNLGIAPAQLRVVNPQLVDVSLHAYPQGCPEQDWVAYGTGVHATSGNAGRDGVPLPLPPVAYPDPVAGLALLEAIATMLLQRRGTGRAPAPAEVTLHAAARAGTGPARIGGPAAVDGLTRWARRAGSVTTSVDGCHVVPVPFRRRDVGGGFRP